MMAARETRLPARTADGLIAGVDIGGTAVKIGLVAREGALLDLREIPTPVALEPRAAVETIARAVASLAGERTLTAVGIGCAGLVSAHEGVVHISPNLPLWREVALGPWAQAQLGLPVAVLNDANAFALAEARIGAGRDRSPVIVLTIGTGVGGAIVIDGLLLGGRHGFGGEAGHMSVDLNGPPCPCGNRGCLELFVGRRPIVAGYLARARWGRGERLFEWTHGDRAAVTPKLIHEAAAQGDAIAREVFARAGETLGAALANLSNFIDPAAFVIGGGIAQAGEMLLGPAREVLAARSMIGRASVAPILPATLGTRAGVIGAALHARDRIAREGAV
jgi:glucokinase